MLVADDNARDHADLAEGARREAKWREAPVRFLMSCGILK